MKYLLRADTSVYQVTFTADTLNTRQIRSIYLFLLFFQVKMLKRRTSGFK